MRDDKGLVELQDCRESLDCRDCRDLEGRTVWTDLLDPRDCRVWKVSRDLPGSRAGTG